MIGEMDSFVVVGYKVGSWYCSSGVFANHECLVIIYIYPFLCYSKPCHMMVETATMDAVLHCDTLTSCSPGPEASCHACPPPVPRPEGGGIRGWDWRLYLH